MSAGDAVDRRQACRDDPLRRLRRDVFRLLTQRLGRRLRTARLVGVAYGVDAGLHGLVVRRLVDDLLERGVVRTVLLDQGGARTDCHFALLRRHLPGHTVELPLDLLAQRRPLCFEMRFEAWQTGLPLRSGAARRIDIALRLRDSAILVDDDAERVARPSLFAPIVGHVAVGGVDRFPNLGIIAAGFA